MTDLRDIDGLVIDAEDLESPAELRRSAREVVRRRQRKIDSALSVALFVVTIFLTCFTVGGMLMVFGYSLFF